MRRLAFLLLFATFSQSSLPAAEGGFCRKCNIMREYHKNNPSKYKYYDDYLKDLEEKGAEAVAPSTEDLPPDVQFIMSQEKEVVEKEKESKK